MTRGRSSAAGLARAGRADGGFTLVELLVVIIVLGLLAAIAVPVFLSQREKAQDAAATADVALLGKELVTWFVDHDVAPALTQDSSHGYLFGAQKIAAGSEHVVLHASTTITSRNDWCVAVVNDLGGASADGLRYSAQEGFSEGLC